MKKITLILAVFIGISGNSRAQITIAAARASALGTAVTVKGIALNGPDLGDVRYIQDNTGNIAVYSSSLLDGVNSGDTIIATGPLASYNALLEISPASTITIVNSGNPLPTPTSITCVTGFVEGFEAKLVQVSAALFSTTGTFSTAGTGTNYTITDAAGTGQVRVLTTTNIDGTPIPVDAVTITGIMSQYAPGGTGGYQLLPRSLTDISTGGNPPVISTPLTQTNISTSSFTVNFSTVNPGTTIIYYGLTTALGSNASSVSMVTTHAQDLTGLTPGTVYYVQGASVSATNDTSFSAIAAMATASNSSGQIKIWFNNTVDNSVSSGTNAVYINGHMDDTIIYFMDHAKYTLDLSIYNIDNINNIITAINDAYARGVDVRVICDSGVDDFNYNLISIGVGKKKKSPPDGSTNAAGALYGIDHNKFLVVDATSTDPNDQWVVTGSMNYTDDQIKVDKQNIVAVQDQSLAKAYRLEFDEMFSGKFGPDKSNNTPHEFIVDGKRVELYFSPSDETETHLIDKISTADYDLYFCIFSFTRYGIAYGIADAVNDRGVFAEGMYDQTDAADSTAVNIVEDALGSRFYNYTGSNLLHHKYIVIDPNCPHSDPLVWTGSHNWSTSANSRNDENSIVIHDSTIANIFYQEFNQRYKDQGGTEFMTDKCDFVGVENMLTQENILLYPNPADNFLFVQLPADAKYTTLSVFSIEGRLLQTSAVTSTDLQVNTSSLQSGMYMLVLNGNGLQRVEKFMVGK